MPHDGVQIPRCGRDGSDAFAPWDGNRNLYEILPRIYRGIVFTAARMPRRIGENGKAIAEVEKQV